MERVELFLLVLALSLCHLRVGSGGSNHFVGKLKRRSTEERDALINFKRSLFDPSHILSNWDINEDCCEWKGVGCNSTTGNIIKIDLSLSSEDFRGRIYARSFDSSLFCLQHLQYLCLNIIYFNNATIPKSISSLTNLYYLDLSYTTLTGVIPPHLGNLTNLQYLDLSWNSLAASNLQWMSSLSSLQYLDMSTVDLTSAHNWLHEIKILPSLSTLILEYCNLQTLPNLLPNSNFSSTINTFDTSFNNFSNYAIPFWLFNMTNLDELYLVDCQLQGMIPINSLATHYKLTKLDLSLNLIDGCIPQRIKNMSNLIYLSLAYNQLSGSIPYSLGQLSKISILNLSHNQLNGSLSDVYFLNLSQLKYLDLSNNQLDFNMISYNWVPSFQVECIFLSSCIIGPNFPSWLKTQKSLKELDLSYSNISDIIPSWFLNISLQLVYINMSNNAIRGEFPMSLNITLNARMIDLSSNLLEGYLPRLTSNVYMALLSNNKFSKGIDRYLNASMSSLALLDLSHNHLYGEIPYSICQMPSLTLLHLSHNNLSGEIPKCAKNISSIMTLKFIGLANNNILGLIPEWVGNLPMLLSLSLSSNNFNGEIPLFKNYSKLISLDLGQNKLTGTIPSWIGENLFSLKILCLRSNKFYGSIPSNLSKLKKLQILYLADNLLSGSLPKSLKFLDSMTIQNKRLEPLIPKDNAIVDNFLARLLAFIIFLDINSQISLIINVNGDYRKVTNILDLEIIMDLSCNNLTGEVPIELMSLVGLRALILAKNQFIGYIPLNIDVMQSLEILDLSMNHLSGEIPESIAKLDKLSNLNLSYNQLSGRIPMGTQLDTFHESSYFGNPELCGKPLIKTCEGDEHDIYNEGSNSQDDDDDFGLFFGMGLGFVVGLCSVLGILLLKKSWAIAYFQLYQNIIDNIYVFVVVKVNQWFNI